jgi:cytochrome c oxidase assembly protein subunit 15
MNHVKYNPLLHRFAVLTMIMALLPIIVGALVTTLDQGMAFRDWPSSDGYNLFFYPWLKSAGGKFIEHGHRLAGALIGFVSIGLALLAWKVESRNTVRWACYAVLLAVIVQGMLGGGRVRLDARALAMVHGSFAALVFALMAGVSVITSRSWLEGSTGDPHRGAISPTLRDCLISPLSHGEGENVCHGSVSRAEDSKPFDPAHGYPSYGTDTKSCSPRSGGRTRQ